MPNKMPKFLKASALNLRSAKSDEVALAVDFELETQEKSKWCWASVTIGAAKYLDTLLVDDQCELVGLVKNCQDCDDPHCNKTGNVREALAHEKINAKQIDEAPSFDKLVEEIDADRPVICDMRDDSDLHSVVVFRCFKADRLLDMVDPATDPDIGFIGQWEESSLNFDVIEKDFGRYFLITDPREVR